MPTTLPPCTGLGLPREAYVSEKVFDAELKRFFYTTWLYAGHESQVREPGQFIRFALGDADVIIIRGRDGVLRGLHNTCRHRGAQLLGDSSGTCRRAIVCSYHAWSYDFDGKLKGAPKMGSDFDPTVHRLRQAEVEVWNGVVFVHVGGGNPAPVAEQLAGVQFANTDIARSKIAKVVDFELTTNWKASWENALECYHCAVNHPELGRIFDVDADGEDGQGFPGGPEYIFIENTLRPGSVSVTPSGQIESKRPYKCDPEAGIERGFLQWHRSAFEMIASPDHVALMTYKPLSPSKSIVTQTFLVPEEAQPGAEFDPDELFDMHIVTRQQDNALCEQIYAGLRNIAYSPGPFNGSLEQENFRFLSTYRSVMGDIIAD
ncbi:aromatic ring-hydroxylating dioxygenase subunit alpha [Saccharopolyspora terrae]|uniref:Aromatic ring-hydroxylating dioxygenase subunit alpha n=1 Tax=Saccharopolyspora terrae TaxID=2530384 RepID=A0A4V2YAD3_9PSEU|nr:aromatic ring-hydroxylating dioxygenase subunit alpha [Saccharopolyspora terrae]TDD03336.1 aromatic ring-hydroxylating dioxygenase subunit alpha [Saccharopolyspora terrae]